MRPLQLREHILLGAVILLGIVGAFYLRIYVPETREAAALAAQLSMQQTALVHLRGDVARARDVEGETRDLQSATRTLEARLTTVHEIPLLVQQLDDLAVRSGVTVDSIKPGAVQAVVPPSIPGRPSRSGEASVPASASSGNRAAQPPQPVGPSYQKFAIEVETRGTYSATARFLHGLESFPRFLALSDVRLMSPRAETGNISEDPVLTLSITATAYAGPEVGGSP